MAPALPVKERVHKTFSDIASYQELLASCSAEWKDFESFISEINSSLEQKFEELSSKEKAFEEKHSESMQALAKREEVIPAREEASLARIQQQKEEALSTLEREKQKLKNVNPNPVTDKDSMDVDISKEIDGSQDDEEGKNKSSGDEVRVRPELKSLCESLDGEGLRKFIVDHRKEIGALRNELTMALQSAIDPSRLVLNALEGYHLLDLDPSNAKETGASANRRACILLLECLAQVLADPLSGVDHPVVPVNIKENAKEVANLWKSKRDFHVDTGNENSLDAQAFLQLLATFGIAAEFDVDELLKLVTAVSRRKQTPALCRSLGLTDKMPGFVESLDKDGKQIEALCFAHFFNIMDKIQPGPMIKAYLKEVRRIAQDLSRNAPTPAAGKNDSIMKELSAVKAVLRTIEEYKLAEHYSPERLLKRLAQLEKAKAEKKKGVITARTQQMQSKKPRIGGPSGVLPPAYDRRPANYSSMYGGDNRSPVNSYVYSADMMGSSAYPSASAYSNLSGGYTGYQYGNGLLTPSAYQSAYL